MSLEDLEAIRVTIVRKRLICGIIGFVLGLLFSILTLNIILFLFCFLPAIGIGLLITSPDARAFKEEFKENYVSSALAKIFDNLNYKPDGGIDESLLAPLNMIDLGDKYDSNDYISGTYKGINVITADVHIEEEKESTDSDGNRETYYVTLFKGRWMIFDFNKKFIRNCQVIQKGFDSSKTNRFGKDKYVRVEFEDIEFNKKFKVFAQNEEEAFYILTPALIQRIKDLSSKLKGKLMLCFFDNKLHVGLDNDSDSFEPNFRVKVTEENLNQTITGDIKLITDFVDELNLDNDLFKKGN